MISRVMRRNICVKKLSTHRTHSGRVGIQLGLLGDDSVTLKPKEKKNNHKNQNQSRKISIKKTNKKKRKKERKNFGIIVAVMVTH